MEFAIAFGVAALLQALESKAAVDKYAEKFAKVYVRIERLAETSPRLIGAITRARTKA